MCVRVCVFVCVYVCTCVCVCLCVKTLLGEHLLGLFHTHTRTLRLDGSLPLFRSQRQHTDATGH